MNFKPGLLVILIISSLCVADWVAAQQSPTRPGGRRPGISGQRGGNAVSGPSRPTAGRSTQRGGSSGQSTVITGGAFDASGVRVVSPGNAQFEPIKDRELEYGNIPPLQEEITITLTGPMSALQYLDTLAVATGWNIVASKLLETVTLQFWSNEMTPEQALAVLKFNDVYYWYDEAASILFLMTKDEYLEKEYGSISKYEFKLINAELAHIETAVTALLSPKGKLIADPRTSTILIMDTKDNIEEMKLVVAKLDQHLESRTYTLEYIDGESIFDTLEIMLSEGGRISLDPRTNTIIIIDRPQQHNEITKVMKTLDKPLEIRTWVLNYADPVLVADELSVLLPPSTGLISVNEELHQITVKAIPNRLDELDKLVLAWDQPKMQVQIEAYLVTVSSAVARNLGVNWSYIDEGDNGTESTSASFTPTVIPSDSAITLGSTMFSMLNDDGLNLVLDIIESDGEGSILAHPRIMVQDGDEAIFESITKVPFGSSTTNFNNSIGNPTTSTQIEFIDVGTILTVIPRISRENDILLDIVSEDSSFIIADVITNNETNTVPEKTQNKASTRVMVANEQTVVIGGLRTSNFTDVIDKVPVLGDIPILGRAFRSSRKDHRNKELLIFITPTIVDGFTQPEAERLALVDEGIAQTMINDKKPNLRRAVDGYNGDTGEVIVSIGQTGGLLANGSMESMEGVSQVIQEQASVARKVVIRAHPKAPTGLAARVSEIAAANGLPVEYDTNSFAFVPAN